MASFQDNLCKPVPECQTILYVTAATDDGLVVVTTKLLRRAKLQSNHHQQCNITQLCTGWTPPKQQCQSTAVYHSSAAVMIDQLT